MNHNEIRAKLMDFGKDCLASVIDKVTGVITVQLGNATDATADSDAAEIWGPPGYYALPANPTAGKPSCQAVNLKMSDHDVIVATRDTRDSSIYGNLNPGERCICNGYPNQGMLLIKSNGSVTLATTDSNTPSGNTMFVRLSPVAGSGQPGGEWRMFAPWGTQIQDGTGFHVRTWHGAKLDMGGLGLPAPFSALGLNSSVALTADVVTIDGSLVSIGRGVSQPVIQAQPLALLNAAVATALTTANVGLAAAAAGLVLAGTPASSPTFLLAQPYLLAAATGITDAVDAIAAAITTLGTTLTCQTKTNIA